MTGVRGANAPGDVIRAERQRQKLTLAHLAEQAGLSASALSQIERGVTDPSIGSLRRIASALKVPFFQLMVDGALEYQLLLVQRGRVRVELGTHTYDLDEGDVISIPRNTPQLVVNAGVVAAEVITIISPANTF